MKQEIIKELEGKKILILGFGREGKSTYNFIQTNNIRCRVGIADKNKVEEELIGQNKIVSVRTGEDYLDYINDYDLVIKSPGISFKGKKDKINFSKITSQTELFLKYGSDKIIGITGTKGKSTTSTLTYEMLRKKYNVMLVGNIGIPAFDVIDEYDKADLVVFELSSHQLENIRYSPHVATVLNMFEEHLDHYDSYEDYKEAKRNIFKNQKSQDYFILSNEMKDVILGGNTPVQKMVSIQNIEIPKETKLIGNHNKYNINVAATIAMLYEVKLKDIYDTLKEFKGLPHRLEYVGKYRDIHFVDDSIATIPEAAISAIESVENVDTIIIGGMDRGVDYSKLVEHLKTDKAANILLINDSGKKIYDMLLKEKIAKNILYVDNLENAVIEAYKCTPKGKTCLLSPAAASYGIFKNFEERGDKFKEYAIKYSKE